MLPFTTVQFLDVFERYNTELPRAAVLLSALALIGLIAGSLLRSLRIISVLLALLWLWAGAVYHLVFFTAVNKAAYGFGFIFITQAVLLFAYAYSSGFEPSIAGRSTFIAGVFLVMFALVGYPLLGYALGHVSPRAPSFGVPCPVTIFTFGVFVMNSRPTQISLLIIPMAWAVVGTSAVFLLGMWQDLSLPIAAGIMVWAEVAKRRSERPLRSS